MKETIDYYNKNAQTYYNLTANVDMKALCDKFLKYVIPGGKIIDIGSGSGRDIKYFRSKGYKAKGIDASYELCRISKEQGLDVENVSIQDWIPKECYDGIWANASLVHITLEELEDFLVKAKGCLKKKGIIYVSMKAGLKNERDEKGRFFCLFDESFLLSILNRNPGLQIVDKWYSQDIFSRKDFKWLNILLK